MYQNDGSIVYSPSDLTLFIESPFASWMDHYMLFAPDKASLRDPVDTMMNMLQDKGGEHEYAVLEQFKANGLIIADLRNEQDSASATVSSMESGVDVIYQGCLSKMPFSGYPDFLVKVEGESKFGNYHYEVWDTKLSKTLKPYFTVQLCCYVYMLAEIQGCRSDEFVIVLGDGQRQRLRTDDYFYYFESVRESFLKAHLNFDPAQMPDPADSNSFGSWDNFANDLLKKADHLSQVATITRSQIKKLSLAGITTMSVLATTDLSRIVGINDAVFVRLKAQAKIQKASEGRDIPLYEVIQPQAGEKQGLALLPSHSKLDVFFDIEGFPLVDGGLEYLWGNTYFDNEGNRQFIDFWAHTPQEEKLAFERFIKWVYDRWQQDPSMHIYHYANYEIAACRKLMSRYGVCEYEVDQLLRNEVFVDLYKIVKSGLLIGEPRYSIKNVEHLYREKRQTEVGTGGDSVVVYDNWRHNPDGSDWQTSKILNDIRDYNIDDCNSTQELVTWLRERQTENAITYLGRTEVMNAEIPDEASDRIKLRDRLLAKASLEKNIDLSRASVTENLAWSLEFHRRESKPVFWRLFDRLGLTEVELFDDLDCLAACQRTLTAPFKPSPKARNLAFEYQFNPNQEFKHTNVKSFYILGEENSDGQQKKVILISEASNLIEGIISVQAKEEPPAIISLVPDEYVRPDPIPKAIDAVVNAYEANSLGQCAILDFMKRDYPRILGKQPGQAIVSSHDPKERLKQIVSAIVNLHNSYLPIQGPPGAGKTFTGKHVIAELLRKGKKVGISSNSHKAINNLLVGTARYCNEQNINAFFGCTKDTEQEIQELGIAVLENKDIGSRIEPSCVIGTTAWGFSREDLKGKFDYLFIDEAGQVSLANLIAMSSSTKNIILMGDQMQLGQPVQGTHPAESGLSILDYLLHNTPTISDDKGIFLDTTYRMHSAVNEFISTAIYQGRLISDPENDQQKVSVPESYSGNINKEAGIIYIPVEHEGNTQASDEEVAAIVTAAKDILGRLFTNKKGETKQIEWGDMLFIAPYNFQVNKLKQALGSDAKVGSVDKFQGQEAPVVFFSMCSSDANDSPRGMDFLFDKNRINVAISRAKSLAIVVGNPKLVNSYASNIQQQVKINTFCQLVQFTG